MTPKVLLLGWGYPPNVSGGLDTALAELFEQFEDRDDIDNTLVLPAEFAPEGRENIIGVPTGEGDVRDRINRLAGDFVDHAADADIVHTNDWFGYGPGSRAQAAHDVEWVTTYHSLSSDRNRQPPDREVESEQRIVDRANHLITVSDLTRRNMQREYGGDATVIHNGFSSVDHTDRDIKAELDIDGPMLFFVGRHTHQKGLDYLVYAMDQLQRDDVTLVLGGTGHLTDQLKKFVRMLGIEDQVEFVGYIEEDELGDYYACSDLFVSPSLSEPFGITIVEALSVGTRVVACKSGAAEVLADDCIVEVEPNSQSIADGIERGLGMDSPIEYEERTWGEVADEHVEFYQEIVDE